MKNIKIALLIMAFVLVLGAGIPKIAKAQTGTVSTTVTIGTVSVGLTPSSFAYGNMPLSTSKESFSIINEGGTKNIKATVGGVITDLDIMGANTTSSGTVWTLAGTAGSMAYVHQFGLAADGTTVPASYTSLTTSYVDLTNDVPAFGSIYFGLKITTPTADTSGVQQTAVVTVLATYGA